MQGATLEALIATHPAGRAAALLQQRAYKVKGKEGMALRQRITTLEEQATGLHHRSMRHCSFALYLVCLTAVFLRTSLGSTFLLPSLACTSVGQVAVITVFGHPNHVGALMHLVI